MHAQPNPSHLRYALRAYLGQPLTPEAAAHIEAMALVNPLPVPDAPGGVVCNEQRPEFFDYLAAQLETRFDPTSSRVLASLGPAGALSAFHPMLRETLESGEMTASEALNVNRFLFDNHVGGLSDETLGRFMRSPEFQAPESSASARSASYLSASQQRRF